MKIKRNILDSSGGLRKKVYQYFFKNTKCNKKDVDYLLSKHREYKTLVLKKGSYVCVFNVVNGNAYVNHLIADKCGIGGIREICRIIRQRFDVKYLVYEREFKKNSKIRKTRIERFIK